MNWKADIRTRFRGLPRHLRQRREMAYPRDVLVAWASATGETSPPRLEPMAVNHFCQCSAFRRNERPVSLRRCAVSMPSG
jgi:hypothetical protein